MILGKISGIKKKGNTGCVYFAAKYALFKVVIFFILLNGMTKSQIYDSSNYILTQLDSRIYPNFSHLSHYPYYISEEAVIGFDTPSLKEDVALRGKQESDKGKEEVKGYSFKDIHNEKDKFMEIEKERRR